VWGYITSNWKGETSGATIPGLFKERKGVPIWCAICLIVKKGGKTTWGGLAHGTKGKIRKFENKYRT